MPYGYIGYENSPNTKNGVFTVSDAYSLALDNNWKTRELSLNYALISGAAGGQNGYAGKGGGSGEIITASNHTVAIDSPQTITVGAGGGAGGAGGDTIAFGVTSDNGTVGTSGNGNGPGTQHHSGWPSWSLRSPITSLRSPPSPSSKPSRILPPVCQ